MKNKYILLRHGQTIYQTPKKRDFLYPWPDFKTGLTKKGIKQAEKAAKELKKEKIDFIYSSDFLRTFQTAGIVAKELGLKKVNLDKRLRDTNWGIFEGGPSEKYRRFFSSVRQRFFRRPPKGENWRDVKKRMKDFIKELENKYKNKTILIVSHGDPIWLANGFLKGISEKKILEVRNFDNLSFSVKGFYPGPGEFLMV